MSIFLTLRKEVINIRKLTSVTLAVLAILLLPVGVLANEPEKTNGFVCPVIETNNVLHSPKGVMIGEGHYTIAGPDVFVPVHATNADGEGIPGGPHSQPGDIDYTAIWAGN